MANRNSVNKIRIKPTQKAKISLFSDGSDFRVGLLYELKLNKILFLTLFRKCQNSDTIEMFQSVSKKISGDGGTVSLLQVQFLKIIAFV